MFDRSLFYDDLLACCNSIVLKWFKDKKWKKAHLFCNNVFCVCDPLWVSCVCMYVRFKNSLKRKKAGGRKEYSVRSVQSGRRLNSAIFDATANVIFCFSGRTENQLGDTFCGLFRGAFFLFLTRKSCSFFVERALLCVMKFATAVCLKEVQTNGGRQDVCVFVRLCRGDGFEPKVPSYPWPNWKTACHFVFSESLSFKLRDICCK